MGHNSAQPCGCDMGLKPKPHFCEQHQGAISPAVKQYMRRTLEDTNVKRGGKLKRHLQEVVNVTWNFSGRLQTPRDHEMNAIVGLAAEAGEVLDVGKKYWFHTEGSRAKLREKLVLELGDVVYYLLKTMDIFGISMKEILAGNRRKLASRHPELGEVKERFSGDYVK